MVQFEEIKYFYLLGILPLLLVVFVLHALWQHKRQKTFAVESQLNRLAPNKSKFKYILKFITFSIGIAFLIIAMVNPKIGTKMETVKREGVDIVFAVDVSKSMLAEDIAPNRLEKGKRLVSEIINSLVSDRIGIIAYAGQAFPQLPITTDYGAAKLFLQSMNTDMLSSQGTAINAAIELAATYYNDQDQTNRILFIITDGEDHSEGSTLEAVEVARENGIKIYTIGVGTAKGAPIPLKNNGVVQGLKKDNNGEVVITHMNEAVLLEIANLGQGLYINGSDTDNAVAFIKDQLQQLDKKEFEAKQFSEYKDQFQWFLGVGALFLLMDVFFLNRKTAWLKKLNLFNEKVYEE